MNEEKDHKSYKYHNETVHRVLLDSYLIFLVAVILGVLFDLITNMGIFSNAIYKYIGFLMLLSSSVVIFWAQATSSNYKKRTIKDSSMSYFEHGPYKYLRNPTHLSVFIMTLGFALIINSFFSVVFTIIAYLITKIFFLKKEENILEKKYGEVYREYKKKVKNWI